MYSWSLVLIFGGKKRRFNISKFSFRCSSIFEDSRKAVLTKGKTNDSQRKEMVQPRAVKGNKNPTRSYPPR